MCDHLSIILGARGDSCKFSAPGRTITGPASDLILSSLHCHALTASPIVHWCPGQPGPRVTRNSKPGLNLWWIQSDELVSSDGQQEDKPSTMWPIRMNFTGCTMSSDLEKSVTVETLIKTNWIIQKNLGAWEKPDWYSHHNHLSWMLVVNLNVWWAPKVQLMIFAVCNKMISMCNLRGRRQLKYNKTWAEY